MPLFLSDTLSATRKPVPEGPITLYVCGVTPYDTTHLGHAFTFVQFDTLVRALFQESSDAALNLDRLATTLGPHVTNTARVRAVEDQVWERAWLTGWKSMRFGRRLWICPHAASPPEDSQAIVVRLDPGLAFGTGTHPTTGTVVLVL